jgi:hypothetical protein
MPWQISEEARVVEPRLYYSNPTAIAMLPVEMVDSQANAHGEI